ncbi:CC0125/CC1285 family lipoprotein [Sphingomonas sp.]|uniref:Uncharacterized protein n=2 Tax=Sphingomonadaceae TaxID=41297 RepID=A0A7X5UXC8_9SPHN|nr:hypothetical protein [Sphingomonas sp.]NIJ64024.1 hypothetical protein [Sphingomonas leidyi]
MTATPYQPATGNGTAVRNGYSDTQIESNRFRISFSGNSLTSRETVERYLLYRAAELTLQQGFDHFILSDRDTEKKTDIVREPGAWGPGPWGYWSPSWRFYRGPRWGWRSWDPFFDDPFWRDRDWDYRTVTQYEAMAEVVMGKGPKPSDNLRAFDAHEVVSRLGPSIQMPATK